MAMLSIPGSAVGSSIISNESSCLRTVDRSFVHSLVLIWTFRSRQTLDGVKAELSGNGDAASVKKIPLLNFMIDIMMSWSLIVFM